MNVSPSSSKAPPRIFLSLRSDCETFLRTTRLPLELPQSPSRGKTYRDSESKGLSKLIYGLSGAFQAAFFPSVAFDAQWPPSASHAALHPLAPTAFDEQWPPLSALLQQCSAKKPSQPSAQLRHGPIPQWPMNYDALSPGGVKTRANLVGMQLLNLKSEPRSQSSTLTQSTRSAFISPSLITLSLLSARATGALTNWPLSPHTNMLCSHTHFQHTDTMRSQTLLQRAMAIVLALAATVIIASLVAVRRVKWE